MRLVILSLATATTLAFAAPAIADDGAYRTCLSEAAAAGQRGMHALAPLLRSVDTTCAQERQAVIAASDAATANAERTAVLEPRFAGYSAVRVRVSHQH